MLHVNYISKNTHLRYSKNICGPSLSGDKGKVKYFNAADQFY